MLKREQCALVVIDVQGKLASLMVDAEGLIQRLAVLIRGARLLDLPVVWVEQNPKGLGPTHPTLQAELEGLPCYHKMAFGCGAEPELLAAINQLGRNQLLLCGIETHVCVYQSARQLLEQGFQVEVVIDAVASRTEANRQLGLDKMQQLGASLTGIEMALFELTERCDDPVFKSVLALVK
ncbi:hydrolase [Ferrimonas marina]|uniref:Nicotinamidase-related amidase n=1 Tax=Ferrimonas marina TaxID=299255 RepID=A0A1M5YVH4_9GAMM|nr:hydrolase [Ferrimonas marina]SHI15850.1 Nicotinamidase-related amidase [Ferrimonas marina]